MTHTGEPETLKVPAGQLVHCAAPAQLWEPAGHADVVPKVEPLAQAYPAVHAPLHAGSVRATVAPYRPPRQLEHCRAPPRLKVPSGHTGSESRVDPAGQM